MNTPALYAFRRFRRVQEFVASHVIADAPASLGKQKEELDAVVAQLAKESLDQDAGFRLTKAETKNQRGLRESLWQKHMLPVARLARELAGVDGTDKALKMPKPTSPNERVLAAARAMAEAAAKHESEFVAHGLAADFLKQLRDAAQRLEDSLGVRDATRRRRVTATASVEALLKRGRRAVRLLNAILTPRIAGDPELKAAWENVLRTKPMIQPADPVAPTSPPTTSPAPVTPAPTSDKAA